MVLYLKVERFSHRFTFGYYLVGAQGFLSCCAGQQRVKCLVNVKDFPNIIVRLAQVNGRREVNKKVLKVPGIEQKCDGHKKHISKAKVMKVGSIFTVEAPLHASNVQVVDPVTGRPCKGGVKYLEDGTKVKSSKRHRSIRTYSYEKSEGHKTL
ncbi:hypothetical protein ABKV19_017223 [Rosa sericea]